MQNVTRRASTFTRLYLSLLTLIFVALAGLGQHSDSVSAGDKEIKPRVERKQKAPLLSLSLLDDPPANAIVAENLLPGSPASEWDISGSGDPEIQGFATDISVDQGQTVEFKIDATSAYKIDIYRLGYYNGLGARKITTIEDGDTAEADQPDCSFDATADVNLVDCGNWSVSASWSVPTDATSGIYIAKPTRLDTNGASHIVFIVRDDDGASDILFQTADTTWQAYNQYGGYSLYAGPGHAHKVSYNRPFTVRGGPVEDWLFNAEYPMLRWLERNGYDVSYTTGIDSDRRGEEILEHKIFMSVGHDEYWSAGQRTKVEAARDAGVNLAFFSGNEIYWKTRWEAATAPNGGAAYRTLVSYKEGSAQGSEHYNCSGNFDCDPHATEWTGLWRQNQTGHDGGQPENSLSGQISWGDGNAAIQVPAAATGLRFWRNTGMSSSTTLEANTLGYEFDWEQPEYASSYPAGRITLSDTTAVGKNHKMSLYRAPSGALVFGAGTVQWSWGLDGVHDRGSSNEDPRMQQATVNLLSDMGVQPGTLQNNLVAGGPVDETDPTISITSPSNNSNVSGGTVTVTGTAADSAGAVTGVVASVEISTDNGTTWKKATGTTSWSYAFAAPVGPATVLARSIDDAANIGPSTSVAFEVGVQECPCTIFSSAIAGTEVNDTSSVELGVKFRSDVDGYITGIRFYKTSNNTGTHTGRLWSTSDNSVPLATVTFTDETASGWQEAIFPTPVAITANTTYVASYHAPNGMYSIGSSLASAGVDNPPLHALQDGVDGPNGVYRYGSGGVYPTDSFNGSNYLVDVKFDETGVSPSPTPTPTPTPVPTPPADEGPGGPILIISDVANPFSRWYAETLQAQGLNAYLVKDISFVNASTLTAYDVVILGEVSISSEQAAILSDWVDGGGDLIAMRPDSDLAPLLGITDSGNDLSNGYLRVDTASSPGAGIVGETIQFHGTADLYTLNAATSVAALYSDATTTTTSPAVTVRQVGTNGGHAVAFTYDLARSIVYTRQGNPAWAGQERDGESGPIRANDMFFPDWVDLDKVAIPQADEQQHLLTNLINHVQADKNPIPRFWFLPKGLKAAVVMTGDDHASGGTSGQFDVFKAASPSGCSVDDWECIRSTSYVYPNTTVTNATSYQADGFEIGLHVNTNCSNWSLSSLTANYTEQLADFSTAFPGIVAPVTNRTHCIAWSDWASQPKVELSNGIRLDTNYYYWPGSWINDRPGMFTGSGMPMRFADLDGTTIDVYQAATQLTDESGQNLPLHIDTLLDNALGSKGYYGVFTANMHTDQANHAGANAIVASAQSRGVPVVSAKQMLTWLDGRNNSKFMGIAWNANTLTFEVVAATGARNLNSMIPMQSAAGTLTSLTNGGNPVPYEARLVKGSQYAIFASPSGTYTATYTSDTTAPTVTATTPTTGATDVPVNVQPTATFNEAMDPATVTASTVELRDAANAVVPATISLNPAGTVVTIASTAALANGTNFTATIKGGPTGVKDMAGNELAAADYSWTFTTAAAPPPPPPVCPCSIWDDSAIPGSPAVTDNLPIEVGVKFRSSVDGYITGIRFYKGTANTGVHVGHLWQTDGTLLGEATFDPESASGWQTVSFGSPIPVAANTTYIASYHSSSGYFAIDSGYFTNSGVTNGPLTALQSGIDGPNGVYRYGASGFPSDGNTANYWVDVVFDDDTSDTTAPTITGKVPAPDETGVLTTANVSATFNENMNPSTINGSTFKLTIDGGSPVSAAVSYSGLTATLDPSFPLLPNTLHHVTVVGGPGGVTDAAGNPLASDVTWSFTTGPNGFTDTTLADFTEGTPDAGISLALAGDGEVILKPLIGDEFFGNALSDPWVTTPWPSSGTATVGAGQLSVNGAFVGSNTVYAAGRSLEFTATFGSESFQHVGFGVDVNNEPYWAMFSTHNVTGELYARTNNGGSVTNTPIAGAFIGSPHRYRVEWLTNEVKFYVDGDLVATHPVAIATPMRPLISDFNANATSVSVDWIRMSEFATAGTFVSREHDAGTTVDWTSLAHTTILRADTAVSFETRTAVSPGAWSDWALVTGSTINSPDGRYLQYRISASSNGGLSSPEVQQVTVSFAVTRVTAAAVTLSGRVLTAQGRGVSAATVVAMDGDGNSVIARTNTFGYYFIRGLGAGKFYIVSATARRYEFAPRAVSLNDNLTGVDFVAGN